MPLSTRPFAHLDALDEIGRSAVNVAEKERIGSVVAGAALIAAGLWRRSAGTPLWLLAGGALVYRGVTGRCQAYDKLGVNTAGTQERGVPGERGVKLEKMIVVGKGPEEVYSYWRNLSNLPKFMPHLKSVEESDDGVSHWVVEGPLGTTVEWDAEIINAHAGEMVSWQTLPGALVQSAGTVRFERVGSGTRVTVVMKYLPPAGKIGAAFAKIVGESPEQQLTEDLQRFKELLESDTAAV